MTAFGGMQLTFKGRTLQAKAQLGAQLHFTRIAIGSGTLDGKSIQELNALITEKVSLEVKRLSMTPDGKAKVGTVLDNQDITSGFYFRELGIFAQDPDEGEVLYCYGNAGTNGEYIPAGSTGGPDITQKTIDVYTLIGNATNVTATIDSSLLYPKLEEFEAHTSDEVRHITTTERNSWNAKETPDGAQEKVNAAIANLINGSPIALDTLNELAQALGDDPNFAATMTNELAKKETPAGSQQKVNAHAGRIDNPHGVTKTQVGLPNVDNVKQATKTEFDIHNSDSVRHITATERTNWNAKETPVGAQAKVDLAIANLINGSPGALDTLNELAQAMGDDPNFAATVTNELAKKETPEGAQAKADAAQTAGVNAAASAEENAINYVKGYGLGVKLSPYSGDLNSLTETGFYYASTSSANKPTSNNGYVINTAYADAGFLSQIFIESVAANGAMHTRTKENGTWRPWTKIETTTGAQEKANAINSNLTSHKNDKNNPHKVTSDQVNSLPLNYLNDTTIPNDEKIPFGISVMRASAGFPAAPGIVVTKKPSGGTSGSYIFQTFYSINGPTLYTRFGGGDGSYWNGWHQQETTTGAQAKVDQAIANLINGSPGALDTLNELAQAMGDDPNFAATVTNELAKKETPAGAQAKVDTHASKKDNPHSVNSSQVNLLTPYSKKAADTARSYPVGVSTVSVRSEDGWFSYGTVTTFRSFTNDGGVLQIYTPYAANYGGSDILFRHGLYSDAGWTEWKEFETSAGAQSKATQALNDAKAYTNEAVLDMENYVQEQMQNAGSWKKLAEITLSASTNYVSLANIPAGYTKFKLLLDTKTTSDSMTYVRVSANDRGDTHATRILEVDSGGSVGGFTSSSSDGAEIGLSANLTSVLEFSYTADFVTRGTFNSSVSRTGTNISGVEFSSGSFQAQTNPIDAIGIRSSNTIAPFIAGSKFVLLALA